MLLLLLWRVVYDSRNRLYTTLSLYNDVYDGFDIIYYALFYKQYYT